MVFRTRSSAWATHIVAWLLSISFPVLFMAQELPHGNSIAGIRFPIAYFEFYLLFGLVFYINLFYLLPRFYARKKYVVYALSVIGLLAIVLAARPFDHLVRQSKQTAKPAVANCGGQDKRYRAFNRPGPHFDIMSLFIFTMLTGLGTVMHSKKELENSKKRALLAEADRANAELSFLKAQINPHFIYNTLNNIYTLCITGSPHAAESIMKLSKIMRYITDEAETNFVDLQDELDCIDNFIELQKLRLGKKTKVIYKVEGNAQWHKIPPLVLMTFVENVFKYGVNNRELAFLNISILITEKQICLYTQNRDFQKGREDNRKGLGIANTRQRLELLYPGRHILSIDQNNNLFTLNLVLNS